MSLLDPLAGVTEFIGKRAPIVNYHAVGIVFVMGYVLIMPLAVSHLMCLLFGAVSYVLLLPQDREPAPKKLGPEKKSMLAEASANRDIMMPQQDLQQRQPVEKHGRAATPAGSAPLAQATPEAEVAMPPRAAAPQKWRASAAAGVDRASADDNWRSRRAATPPWESRRQRAPELSEKKIALSSGLSAARRVLAKEAA